MMNYRIIDAVSSSRCRRPDAERMSVYRDESMPTCDSASRIFSINRDLVRGRPSAKKPSRAVTELRVCPTYSPLPFSEGVCLRGFQSYAGFIPSSLTHRRIEG